MSIEADKIETPEVTIEDLRKAFPLKARKFASREFLDLVNEMVKDPDFGEVFRQNIFAYSSVIQKEEARYNTPQEYLNAVKYCTFRIAGLAKNKAYALTFPDRFQKYYLDVQTSSPEEKTRLNNVLATRVTSYNQSKLVNQIMAQALIPTWIINQDVYQEAINVQVDLMRNAKSEMVRMKAADSLLDKLKRPEAVKQAEVQITLSGDNQIEALKKSLMELAQGQKKLIEEGMDTHIITDQTLKTEVIDAEVIDERKEITG